MTRDDDDWKAEEKNKRHDRTSKMAKARQRKGMARE